MTDFTNTKNIYLNYNFVSEWSMDPYYNFVDKNILSNEFINEVDILLGNFLTSKGVDLSKPEHLYIIELDSDSKIYGIDYVFFSKNTLENYYFQSTDSNITAVCEPTSYCFIKNIDKHNLYRMKLTIQK